MGRLLNMQMLLATTLCLAGITISTTFLPAQTKSNNPARPVVQPQQRSRASLPKPELRVQKLSPELEKVLVDWYKQSKGIKRLEGAHYRYVYDKVFQTEKRAIGKFWYEGPDKGRIDIEPREIKAGEKSKKKGSTGKPYALKSSEKQERWICDGKSIMTVNVKEKTYEMFPIPPDKQGENIMDGPLPFLFGMPPVKAKARYYFRLDEEAKKFVRLSVKPKLRQDAANWSIASVILSKPDYLPSAVQIVDPGGNLETVYKFGNLDPNAEGPWKTLAAVFGGRPFDKPGFGYKLIKLEVSPPGKRPVVVRPPRRPALKKDQALVPSVVGLSYKDAEKILERSGFKTQLKKGTPTANKRLLYHVERQQPIAKTPFKKGQTVAITLYTKSNDLGVRPGAKQTN